MKIKKNKEYKRLLAAAKDMLFDVSDEELSTVAGIQKTMNRFLNAQGLPSVGFPGVGVPDRDPERRSFEDIENELSDLYNISCDSSSDV